MGLFIQRYESITYILTFDNIYIYIYIYILYITGVGKIIETLRN
jgi:hypothetical protein